MAIAGGMESMSQVPHYLNGRQGVKLGNLKAVDGMVLDGLTDVYNNHHMGLCAELCAGSTASAAKTRTHSPSKATGVPPPLGKAVSSPTRWCPCRSPNARAIQMVTEDEEFRNVAEKIPALRPVFEKEGSVTAANASTLNDGASALVLMSAEKAVELGITPVATILSNADAAHEPERFTTAPAKALPIALDRAGMSMDQMDLVELNEAFSVVGLANVKLLGLDTGKVNVNGGAVSLATLGSSGSRIVVTLIHALKRQGKRYGAAGICNGGGGASAMIIDCGA